MGIQTRILAVTEVMLTIKPPTCSLRIYLPQIGPNMANELILTFISFSSGTFLKENCSVCTIGIKLNFSKFHPTTS